MTNSSHSAMKTVNLTETVAYLRELLEMNRQQLLSEVRHHPDLHSRTRKNELLAYAFELKFDSTAKPPTCGTGNTFDTISGVRR